MVFGPRGFGFQVKFGVHGRFMQDLGRMSTSVWGQDSLADALELREALLDSVSLDYVSASKNGATVSCILYCILYYTIVYSILY